MKLLSFIVCWTMACTFVFNRDVNNLKFVGICFNAIGMGVFLSSVSFQYFREGILKIATLIAFISIVVQIGHNISIFPATDCVINNTTFKYSLYIFNTEWGGMNRLSSIYWEPGQYQIVLSYVLCLFADELCDFIYWKKILRKFGILIIAFVMTQSTMGYIVMMLIVVNLLINANNGKRGLLMYPMFLVIGITVFSFLYNSDTIQDKIEQSENPSTESSYTVRLADNIALLSSISEKPLTGWGPGSKSLSTYLTRSGSMTDSNGILLASAELGIVYLVFFIVFFFLGIIKMHGYKLGLGLGIPLILSQMNEVGYFLPIAFLYLFRFKNYNKGMLSKLIIHRIIYLIKHKAIVLNGTR